MHNIVNVWNATVFAFKIVNYMLCEFFKFVMSIKNIPHQCWFSIEASLSLLLWIIP